MSSTPQSKRSTLGWDRAIADPDHRGEHAGNLVVDTEAGPTSISYNAKVTGPNAGERWLHAHNADGSWTTIVLDPHGAMIGIGRGRRRDDANDAVHAPGPRRLMMSRAHEREMVITFRVPAGKLGTPIDVGHKVNDVAKHAAAKDDLRYVGHSVREVEAASNLGGMTNDLTPNQETLLAAVNKRLHDQGYNDVVLPRHAAGWDRMLAAGFRHGLTTGQLTAVADGSGELAWRKTLIANLKASADRSYLVWTRPAATYLLLKERAAADGAEVGG